MDAWERAARAANETMRAAARVEELCRKLRTDGTRAAGEVHVQRVCADVRDAVDSLMKWTQQTNSAVRTAQREEVRATRKSAHASDEGERRALVIIKEANGAATYFTLKEDE